MLHSHSLKAVSIHLKSKCISGLYCGKNWKYIFFERQLRLRCNLYKESVGYYHAFLLLSFAYVWYNTQDGSYNYVDFTSTFEEYEIQRVMRAYENSITINLHCCAEGDWQQEHINKEQFSEFCQVEYQATIFYFLNRWAVPKLVVYFLWWISTNQGI